MSQIKLTRSGVEIGSNLYQSYVLRIDASDPEDMPAEIFMYQKNRIIVNGTVTDSPDNDVFISVADPVDLQEYPDVRPLEDDDNQYYRQDFVEIFFRNMNELETTWEYIKEDVRGLVHALNMFESMVPQEEVTITG